jgi:transglutaminase-like putative cysteine protease
MKVVSPLRLTTRLHKPAGGWDIALRYGAAYACTLIAVGASQLVLANEIVWLLSLLTIIGLPISLWLRHEQKRGDKARISRTGVNFVVFLLTIGLICYVLALSAPRLLSPNLSQFLILSSAGQIISLLMEVFLVFAACRCLAIISDKDAVLCTVPSFSVMLLLIVVHKGPEVVVYFFLWAVVSAILLALDHRSDVRQSTIAYVPAPIPGQEVKLSARGLASVLGFSLLCAFGLSYTLSGRDPETRSTAEGWIGALASRLTQLALDLPDVSVNAGPERQIDYSSGPVLPTHALIWQVETRLLSDGRILRPHYWRMFTLADYDGRTWSQVTGSGRAVPRQMLTFDRWPLPPGYMSRVTGADIRDLTAPDYRNIRRSGYDIERFQAPGAGAQDFGVPRQRVRQIVTALVSNTGYVPALPAIRALRLRDSRPNTVRLRSDNSVDIGVLRPGQSAWVLSEVTPQWENGLRGSPPEWKNQKPNPAAALSAQERRLYLQLPEKLPRRVRQWTQRVLARDSDPRWSDYRRARALMVALQQGSVYTLRPPAIPEGRDAVDFFLFESRRGYCTYFAGAMTVACRAAGIPARVVSGFTNPEWLPSRDKAALRESNVHAWTEIWVPNWGWATIDATPPDDRGNNAPSWYDNWQDILGASLHSFGQWVRANLAWTVSGLLFFVIVLLLAFSYFRREALRHFLAAHGTQRTTQHRDAAARQAVFVLYHKLSRKLSRRFRPPTPWETPLEWTREAEVSLRLRDPQPLRRLAELYAQAKYSPTPLGINEVEAARSAWAQLSWEQLKTEETATSSIAHQSTLGA